MRDRYDQIDRRFRDLIAHRFGLRFDDNKLAFLNDVLKKRAGQRATTPQNYLELVQFDAGEAHALGEELTVGETYFFRNKDQFDAFRDVVLVEAMERNAATHEFRFLSAGCSTGEEPYSLAMLLKSVVPMPPWKASIQAIDLNPASLRKAQGGRFGSWSLREMPEEMDRKWLVAEGREKSVAPEVREMVRFDCANLADPGADFWQPAAYDAIFCRNVIMYFTPSVQHAVVSRLARSLVPGGYLFLGHAETLRGLSQDFHLVHTHDTFYYQRRSGADFEPARHFVPASFGEVVGGPAVAEPPLAPGDYSWFETIGNATRRIEALSASQPAPERAMADTPHWSLESVLDLLKRERFSEALRAIALRPKSVASDPEVIFLYSMLLF
jgi:chemotaxis protein methyltransferase CheR